MQNNIPNIIESILEHARWAPSGDNTQPWRFEITGADQFTVHGHDTRDHCVYDLKGHASQLALGALLESIAIAASAFQKQAHFSIRPNMPETQPTIEVTLTDARDKPADVLFPYLPIRSVQRRPFKTTPLTSRQKQLLESSVGDFYRVHWFEGFKEKFKLAFLMFKNGKLRLTMPEAYQTHSSIIEWRSRFSEQKVPDQAVGLDPVATRLMEWTLKSWNRVKFFNTFMAGTLLPRIELDFIPGLYCAAHFMLIAREQPQTLQDFLNAGRALQRFWLTATSVGLQLQPEMTPLIFSGYIRNNLTFTAKPDLTRYAQKLADSFEQTTKNECDIASAIFMGRIGQGKIAYARSIRLPINSLKIS